MINCGKKIKRTHKFSCSLQKILDAGPPLQRSNRTVTIQMLTPNLSNSGSRVRERNGMWFLIETNRKFCFSNEKSLVKDSWKISAKYLF